MATISERIKTLRLSCAPLRPRVNLEISTPWQFARERAHSRAQGDRRGDPRTCKTCIGEFWTRSWYLQNRRGQSRCCRPRASRARHFGFTCGGRLRDATDHYRPGDKRVDSHDCGPRRHADSRLTTGDRMPSVQDKSLTIDTHHHILCDFFWQETENADIRSCASHAARRGWNRSSSVWNHRTSSGSEGGHPDINHDREIPTRE